MRRRALAACLAVACATGLGAQDWRTRAVESFDTAWQTINDTFYDPTFGGLDWPAVREELRPRVLEAGSADEARDVIRRMLARLGRSHFALLSSSSPADTLPGPAVVPADVRIVDGRALVTRVTDAAAARAGLAAGHTLLSIGDTDVSTLVTRAEGVDARTTMLDAWRRVNQALHGDDGSIVALRVAGVDGREQTVRVMRARGAGEVVTLGNLPPLRVAVETREVRTPRGRRAGVVWFSVWMAGIAEPLERAIDAYRMHDGLVIDLRGNPGGLAAMMRGVAGHMIDKPAVLGTMRTRQTQLTFTVNPRRATTDGRAVAPFRGPVAILVDELTGSTSETFAGALQSLGRARVFGRPTMGQALPALTKRLPNGDVLIHAVGDFVTSTGRSLEGAGVAPDVIVPLSAASLAAGRDDVLVAALRWFDATSDGPFLDVAGGT
jgi:carboxyl-terminal processing protease